MTREPTEMELRIAKAICRERGIDPDVSYTRPDEPPRPQYLEWIDEARAAIRAMREPTDEMLTSGYAAGYEADNGVDEVTEVLAEIVYTAMIDAASPEDK